MRLLIKDMSVAHQSQKAGLLTRAIDRPSTSFQRFCLKISFADFSSL